MSIRKLLIAAALPVAALTLGGCATGFQTQVSRFQAMPAPQGETFVIQAADPANRGGLEFSRYADLVRRHLIGLGYREAAGPEGASLVVSLDYGVDNGRERVVSHPDPWSVGYGFRRPFYSRFGYFGRRRSPFYWGWHDPFWGGGAHVSSFTVYRSYLDMDIRRAGTGEAVFEGLAQAQSDTNQLQILVPNLVEAMFTGFPGNSGETVRITVPSDRTR